jgi:drug/metabolite transporter (DMT)-like permease
LFLTVAGGFQQYGLLYTSVGNAGFITTLYVIFVPLCGLFFKKMPTLNIWVSVIIATAGLYLLCMGNSFSLSFGDTLILICAVCYTAHIMVVDKFTERCDPVKLSCIQFLTVGVVSLVPAIIFESITIGAITSAWLPIMYAGLLSSGVAFTLQAVAQRYTEPTIAAITMSFESVFAVLSGCVILHDIPTVRELWGCIIMFVAIILAQLPSKWFRLREKSS